MKKYIGFAGLFICLVLMFSVANADILTDDNMPSVNSNGNLPNGGQVFCDGEYFYSYIAPHGYLKRFNYDLEYESTVQDSVATDARYSILDDSVYFVGRKKKGIYKLVLEDGDCTEGPTRIVNADILNYTLDTEGIYYSVNQQKGVWRADLDGGNRKKLSNHQVRYKNNVVRMSAFEGMLYYINDADHCLYAVPCDGSAEAQKVSNKKMHYFVMGVYKGKTIIPYVRYASSSDELNNARLGVIYSDGSEVEELDYLERITSRYINFMGGYLYYADSKDHKYLKRVLLDASAPESTLLIREPVGYILAYDGWIVASYMTEHMEEAAYFFINLETMDYKKVYNISR